MDDRQIEELVGCMRRFLPLCMETLGLDSLPRIIWVTKPGTVNGDHRTFGTFASDDMSIRISLRERHPLDIMRTLAHELTHYRQMLNGEINGRSGITGSPQENEANAMAGIIMRHFDHAYPGYFKMKALHEDTSKRGVRIEPKTLDAIVNIQNYGRDVRSMEKKAREERQKSLAAKKKADAEKRRETDPEFKTYIQVYMILVPVKAIRYWRESRDVDFIQKVAKGWRIVRKSWPKEVLSDIYSNPEWRENVIKVFDIANNLLRLKELPKPNRGPAIGRLALDRLGEDPQEAIDVYSNLTNVVKRTLAKHNIDKHGLRLPPKR